MSKFSICPDTGLRICEYFKHLLVREDGMVKNINPYKNSKPIGWKNGSMGTSKYQEVRVPGSRKMILIHRLIALSFITNPKNYPFVDHIDGDKKNNHIGNLRWVTRRQNNSNKACHRAGRLIGAHYYKPTNKWVSFININGKSKNLGYFLTALEAHQAYLSKLTEISHT